MAGTKGHSGGARAVLPHHQQRGRKQTRLILNIGDTIHLRGDNWTISAFLANGHVRLERVDEDGANLQAGFRVEKVKPE